MQTYRTAVKLCILNLLLAAAVPAHTEVPAQHPRQNQTQEKAEQQTRQYDWQVTSGSRRNVLLELYTSEGCSSCPPADAWLSRLQEHPQLFTRVVPVALHVTYWNYLGWRDPFAFKEYDRRHRRRAADARAGVYTPGMFAQGREWRGWRRQPETMTFPAAEEAGRLSARAAARQINVRFEPAAGISLQQPVVFLTYLGMDRSSRVAAGENAGRLLQHNFVAGRLHSARLRQADGIWQVMLDAPAPDPADAVALWVQDRNQPLVQAAGGYLN